jgi:hypothetical protein
MELDGDHIRITQRGQIASLPLQALTNAPALRKGMIGTAPTINSQERTGVTLKAADPYAYMRETLTAIANRHPASRIDDLMPWAFQKPSS